MARSSSKPQKASDEGHPRVLFQAGVGEEASATWHARPGPTREVGTEKRSNKPVSCIRVNGGLSFELGR